MRATDKTTDEGAIADLTISINMSDLTTTSTSVSSYIADIKYRNNICNKSLNSPLGELEYFSDELAFTYLPVIVFVAIIMILGIIGNIIVLYIYLFEYRHKPSNSFIIAMAMFDFLASTISMPLEIHDMRHHYTYFNHASCKALRFFETLATYASTIILILIAIDRYLKICRPLLPESVGRCKIMCATATVGGIVLAIPTLWLFGINRVAVPGKPYCGYDCSVSLKYYETSFQKIYFSILLGIFFLTFSVLVGFYVHIWKAIKTRRHSRLGDRALISKSSCRSNDLKEENAILKRSCNLSSTTEDDSFFVRTDGKIQLQRQQSSSSWKSGMSRISNFTKVKTGVKCTRTTKIFIAVSVAFILSFLPCIIVNLLRANLKNIQKPRSKELQVILKLLARFHFINHAVNPIIYSFLNTNFRNHCKSAFSRLSAMFMAKFVDFKD